MRSIVLLFFCASLLIPVSCINPVTVKSVTQLVALGIEVVNLLKGCSELSQMFSTKVSQVNSGMEMGIKNNESILTLGKYWEKYWGDVHSGFDNLQSKLIETDMVSQQYFAELDRNNSLMNDPELKSQDMNKTLKLKEEYKIEYAKALSSLGASQKLLQDGDDILLALRNDILRSALNSQIDVLKNITSQSTALSQNIEYFSETCIPLFTQNQ